MGGGHSKKDTLIDKGGWETITKGQSYDIVRDKNGRTGQEYKYVLDNRYSPSDQFDIFQKRKNTSVPIVKTYMADNTIRGTTLVPQNQFTVITQRVKHKLSEIPQLTYPETLYVLDRSLNGYQLLYDKVGPFGVNGDMIGFTQQGQTRVWLNENFGNNHPSHQRHILQSTLADRSYLSSATGNMHHVSPDEAQMVRNIVHVIEGKCQKGIYPQPFKSKIQAPLVGFRQAQDIVNHTISDQGHFRFNSIDLIKNMTRITKWGQTQQTIIQPTNHHYISHNEMINQRPIVQEIIHNYVPQSQAHYISNKNFHQTYQPMPSAKKTNMRFNYIQPKEAFHPSIYAGRY